MSKNTGCTGAVIIPKSQFNKLAKSMIERHNISMEKDILKFNTFVDNFLLAEKENKQRKTPQQWENSFQMAYEKTFPQNNYRYIHYFECLDTFDALYQAVRKFDAEGKSSVGKPKKLKFKKIKLSKTEIYTDLPFASEASFSLEPKKQKVFIHVSYNNHNLEEAIDNPFYKFTLSLLKAIEYTRGTGGTFDASEERDVGEGSGNYVLADFGPKPKK